MAPSAVSVQGQCAIIPSLSSLALQAAVTACQSRPCTPAAARGGQRARGAPCLVRRRGARDVGPNILPIRLSPGPADAGQVTVAPRAVLRWRRSSPWLPSCGHCVVHPICPGCSKNDAMFCAFHTEESRPGCEQAQRMQGSNSDHLYGVNAVLLLDRRYGDVELRLWT